MSYSRTKEKSMKEIPRYRSMNFPVYSGMLNRFEDSDEIRSEMINTAVRRGYPYELASSVYGVWSQGLC